MSDGLTDRAGELVNSGESALRDRVLGWVAVWIVAGVLAFRDAVAGLVLDAVGASTAALRSAGASLAQSLGAAGAAFTSALDVLGTTFVTVTTAAGPLAFVLWPAFGAILAWIAYRTVRWLIARVLALIQYN